jgi:hypothetical protein
MTSIPAGNTIAMICGGAFALALGALGLVLIVLYLRNKNKAKASMGWPSTQGRILSTNIRVDEVDDESNRVRYVPEVHFEYTVNGVTHEGKRIIYGSEPDFGSRDKAQEFLQKYPQGALVTVFYNPENPGEAVLSQGMRKMVASLVVGIILIVLMICFLCPIGMGLVNLLRGG